MVYISEENEGKPLPGMNSGVDDKIAKAGRRKELRKSLEVISGTVKDKNAPEKGGLVNDDRLALVAQTAIDVHAQVSFRLLQFIEQFLPPHKYTINDMSELGDIHTAVVEERVSVADAIEYALTIGSIDRVEETPSDFDGVSDDY